MSLEILIVAFTVIFVLVALYRELASPLTIFFVAVLALLLSRVLSPREVLEGFSNEQIAIIAMLLLIGGAIYKTGILDVSFDRLFKKTRSERGFLGRILFNVSVLSSFLSNTLVVSLALPYVYEWCRNRRFSPSKFLIPLSYAAILGGSVTLIGTSTNLVLNGLLVSEGFSGFGMFDFAYVGIPLMIVGLIYLYYFSPRMLPEQSELIESFFKKKRDYLVEVSVRQGAVIAGKTVEEAELRNLKGVFLAEIIRGDRVIAPVSPEDRIEEGDVLIFVGDVDKIVELIKKKKGLSLLSEKFFHSLPEILELVEAVVSNNSSLVNKRVRESNFRAKFDAVILAVHRNGERLKGKIGDIILKAGDVLLLLPGIDFWKIIEDKNDLYLISEKKEFYNVDLKKGFFLVLLFFGLIVASSFRLISLFTALAVVLFFLFVGRLLTYSEMKQRLDFNLIVIAALSLSLGRAIIKSGASQLISESIVRLFSGFGSLGYLIAIYVLAVFLTQLVTNLAAASIVFPIAISLSQIAHLNPLALVLAVAYGASANFLTPFGYQTNLMVYGPGNYSFKDFFKIGLPLLVIYSIVCVVLLYFFFL